ncbi:hypothetical protein Tco_1291635 [Tanacetum coccineum]
MVVWEGAMIGVTVGSHWCVSLSIGRESPGEVVTVASISTVRLISIDDYEVTGADDQATADGNVTDKDANPFPNVDDAELNVAE